MASGDFYRAFTKIMDFQGHTKLSLIHGHYFTLGMFFCLFLLILEKLFQVLQQPKAILWLKLYHVGLNITGGAFLVRGITEVLAIGMSKGMDASLSGVAGIVRAASCLVRALMSESIRSRRLVRTQSF
jgi:Na+-driven multidrug efflux pump